MIDTLFNILYATIFAVGVIVVVVEIFK